MVIMIMALAKRDVCVVRFLSAGGRLLSKFISSPAVYLAALSGLAISHPTAAESAEREDRQEKKDDALIFVGSYWNTADSFSLTIDFSKMPAVLDWDGYADPSFAYENQQKGKLPGTAQRVRFSLKLTTDEEQLFRRTRSNFHHCDPGPSYSLGTGLSTAVVLRQNGEEKGLHYFATPRFDLLAQAGESLPMRFQILVGENGLEETARAQFFRELGAFDDLLEDYDSAMKSLQSAMDASAPMDWSSVWELVATASKALPWKSRVQEVPDEETPRELIEKELPQLLSAYSAHLSEAESRAVIFWIESMGTDTAALWGDLRLPGPGLLRSENGKWACLPTALKLFIEDFVEIASTKRMPYQALEPHKLFELHDISEAERHRLQFIDQSNLYEFLLGRERQANAKEDTSEIRTARIFRLGFSKDGTRAVLFRPGGDGNVFDEMKKSTEGEWKYQRTLSYEKFEREVQQAQENARIIKLNGGRDIFAP